MRESHHYLLFAYSGVEGVLKLRVSRLGLESKEVGLRSKVLGLSFFVWSFLVHMVKVFAANTCGLSIEPESLTAKL